MKKISMWYWIITGLMAALITFSAIPDIVVAEGAVLYFSHLGYPAYLLPFLGVAKVLGVIAVLMPGFNRLKEWAYAGFVFDLAGAIYSGLAIGEFNGGTIFQFFYLALICSSYYLFRVRERYMAEGAAQPQPVSLS